jgi:FKBP-type peptidyl-prolyl cis-trans isomerase FklB
MWKQRWTRPPTFPRKAIEWAGAGGSAADVDVTITHTSRSRQCATAPAGDCQQLVKKVSLVAPAGLVSALVYEAFTEVWDNVKMQKTLALTITPLAFVTMLAGSLLCQQTPAASTPPAAPATKATQTPGTQTPAQTSATKPKTATSAKTAAPLALKTQKEKFSYALGMNIGSSMKRQSVTVDPAILARGLKDTLAGGKTLMTEDEARATLKQTQDEMRQKMQAKMQEDAAVNKKAGEAFLAANKTKEGVVTLPSGLQYKILKAGTGPKPTTSDSVVCNYKGTLIDGKEFDSSYKRGEPATFPVTGVIKGWTEALQLMPVGSKWQLFVPSDLAYGDPGRPGIDPGATLIFEVELVSIADKSQEKK